MSQLFPNCMVKAAAQELGVEPRVVKAVVQVESSGSPFLPAGTKSPRGLDLSGFPTVQFEGHVFWSLLLGLGKPELEPLHLLQSSGTADIIDATGKPIGELLSSILYRSFTLKFTLKPRFEWDQLTAARAIHQECADKAASWGSFQILGMNHKAAGHATVAGFVKAQGSLEGQLQAFISFIAAHPKIKEAMRKKDFKTFALAYNGSLALKNGYDKALQKEYARAVV